MVASSSAALAGSTQDVGAGIAVSLVAWPADEDLRRHLSSLDLPRLLLVDAAAPPPISLDHKEDWVRLPADAADLRARAVALVERTASGSAPPTPVLDDDGLLHVGSSWVHVTTAQMPVVRLLVDRFDRVVTFDAIATASVAGGGTGSLASVRTLLARLGRRMAGVGLELTTVRQRGVLLRTARPAQSR